MKLQSRFNLAFTSLVIILLAIAGLIIYSLILELLINSEEKQLEQKGELLVQFIQENAHLHNSVEALEEFLNEQDLQFIVYDGASESVLMSTLDLAIVEGFYQQENFMRDVDEIWIYKKHQYVVSKILIQPDVSEVQLILLTPLTDLQEVQKSYISRIALIFIIGAFLAVAFSSFVTRRLVTPLEHLQREVEKIERREFDDLVPIEATGEIKEVAKSVNHMALELKQYIDSQQTFFQNASHELKTPLMTIQGYAEGVRDGIFEGEDAERGLTIIATEVHRLKSIINEMTLLAKLDSEETLYQMKDVLISDVLNQAVLRLEPFSKENEVEVKLHIEGDFHLYADEEKLLQACLNIISNGIRYAEKVVEIRLQTNEVSRVILIEDDGPGIDPVVRENLFHRFVKGSDGETGLGLAISRAIFEKSGGQIRVSDSSLGGALFIIKFDQNTS